MQSVQKLYDLFAEEAYANAVECEVVTQGEISLSERTTLFLEKWDAYRPLFSAIVLENGKVCEQRVTIEFNRRVDFKPSDPPKFSHLFWIEPIKLKGRYAFKYIECGLVTPLEDCLDIGIDDDIRVKRDETSIDKLRREFENRYVFDAGRYKFLVIKAFVNGRNDWDVYGFKSKECTCATIPLESKNDKKIRVVRKLRSQKMFPHRFDEVEIVAYRDIAFVDVGLAGEAHEALLNREHSGNAVLALWEKYSSIELERATDEKEALGILEYEFVKRRKGRCVYVRFKSLSSNQADQLIVLASSKARFELADDGKGALVVLLRYNSVACEAEFDDEFYILPSSGRLCLSLVGDKIVDNRRRFAKRRLLQTPNIVLHNLLFAIEGEADKIMIESHKRIPALTEKTRIFLREKFGIAELTDNQKCAVEMALNNRKDITIIQGPPGTGKTTVVAAICHRLVELEKDCDNADKIILASAFQNDTIENLASKIYTHGLPTIKLGRKSNGIRAEEKFIAEMKDHLTESISARGGDLVTPLSDRLFDLAYLATKENDFDGFIEQINIMLPPDTQIPDIDFVRLSKIKDLLSKDAKTSKSVQNLIARIPQNAEAYNEKDGFSTLIELTQCGLNLSEDDQMFLIDPPERDPTEEFMEKLTDIKNRLEKEFQVELCASRKHFKQHISEWLMDAAKKTKRFEECNFENRDACLCAVLRDLKQDLDGSLQYVRRTLQNYGLAVAATNQLAGSREMSEFPHVKNVILEEAARSNPLDLIIPMTQAEDRVIMVGDQNQLPHLLEADIVEQSLEGEMDIEQKRVRRDLYQKPLFEIIFKNVANGTRPRCITLEDQFRMHPTIGDFISKTYYDGHLKNGSAVMAKAKEHHLSIPWAQGKTMVFCHVDGKAVESGGGISKSRKAEVARIFKLLDEMRSDSEFKNLSVGIITFYSQQVNLLFEEASKPEYGFAVKTADGFEIHPDYRVMEGDNERFRIGSVDSFQGKEFDVVILSAVRSNKHHRVARNEKRVFGFLTLQNRLNVAFSRAKKLLIVVGDGEMFTDEFAKEHVHGLHAFCTEIAKGKEYGNWIN